MNANDAVNARPTVSQFVLAKCVVSGEEFVAWYDMHEDMFKNVHGYEIVFGQRDGDTWVHTVKNFMTENLENPDRDGNNIRVAKVTLDGSYIILPRSMVGSFLESEPEDHVYTVEMYTMPVDAFEALPEFEGF